MAAHSLCSLRLRSPRSTSGQARQAVQAWTARRPGSIKEGQAAAATTVYVTQSLRVVDNLKTILAPALCVPHTAQQLHEYLGYEGQLLGTQRVIEVHEETRGHEALTYNHSGTIGTWTPGQALRQPAPLFQKPDESMVEEGYAWLEG